MNKSFQNGTTTLVVFLALTLLAYVIAPIVKPIEESGLDTGAQAIGLRFLLLGVGALLILALCYFTREHPAWAVRSREVAYMAVGATLHAVFVWLFNGITFPLPALSQVALLPAVILPVFFGFMFGPMVGFMSGAVGSLIGDLFVGAVNPHWALAYGIIGLCAGLPAIFADKKQSLNVVTGFVAVSGVAAAIFYLANPTTQFSPPPDFAPTSISFFLGMSVAVGASLAVLVRFAFPNRPNWGVAVLWGSAGNIIGLAAASKTDLWTQGDTLAQALVGKFVTVAGPNLIAVAILIPLLLFLYTSAQQSSSE
jgi:uncharacterized membrane protein